MTRTPRIAIITPALAAANNGNWQTAARWQRFLKDRWRVECSLDWDRRPADLMIALHARRSAQSIADFHETGRPIVLVLTGTDLYRDIQSDRAAQTSLSLADALVCLQDQGPARLPISLRPRCRVIFQSAPRLAPLPPRSRTRDLVLVGHLRPEKDPMTAVSAVRSLSDPRVRLFQIGEARDPGLRAEIEAASASDTRIHMLGGLPHAATRRWIRSARALLLPSLMEGGANVVVEAAMSDVPVLASRIDGSVGMLGEDYDGFFPVGDTKALAGLIRHTLDDAGFHQHLRNQVRARSLHFEPSIEREQVQALVAGLLASSVRAD